MKKKILTLIILIIVLAAACKQSTTEPTIETQNNKYFSLNDGSSYVYNLEISDSTGLIITGFRSTLFYDSTIIDGTTYKIQKDSFLTTTGTQTNVSFVRESSSGVFYYADTTGLTSFVPDSLRQYLLVDRESRILFYPLAINQTFPVYTISLINGNLGVSLVDLYAKVEAEEILDLTLNGSMIQKKAFRIKYNFIIKLSETLEYEYQALGWTVKDIGFVKLEGDAEVFNFLLNGNLFPAETNIKMNLFQYSIP